jgi:acyl-homoserine lactone acylase PvdQ
LLRVALCTVALVAAAPTVASAQLPPLPGRPAPPTPEPYRANDGGGFHDILPSGTRGLYDALELALFVSKGQTVPHCCDQLPMYAGLLRATPGLKAADVGKYFKDSSFGVPPGRAERVYSPRADVTIVRDRAFGVPHVYGRTRAGAMFGLGYVGAEDRLFSMDLLRHAGRGELASFAGGANAAMDAQQWAVAPYTEADLRRQALGLPRELGAQGAQLKRDVDQWLAGVNEYIDEAKLDPTKMPGEYIALGHPEGPAPFTEEDLIATASLVGGIFGQGGGNELQVSQIADALEKRFGRRRGDRILRDFRAANDPEAPVTVFKRRFPYERTPRHVARGSVARPDRGSLKYSTPVSGRSGGIGLESQSPVAGLLAFPARASNALLVSARESASGHPLMVAGPQVGYFNPQILMEEDVHAPASADGPGIDAAGAAFDGINMYVQLGRGRDYAWSATSAGQDIIDTFALPLCDKTHYRFVGHCYPIEVLQKTERWTPNLADQTPAGSQTLRAERTKLGLVAGRGTIHGKPVIFTKLRSTYFHEVDSAAGFMDFNTPSVVRSPATFKRAANKIGYTFNWFYADSKHIAYFNSGQDPVRAPGTDPNYPVWGRKLLLWRGFLPAARHPQAVDQRYLVNWNNKQARGFAASDENAYSSTYRSVLLERQVKRRLRGGRKLTLPGLIDAMGVGGAGDLRAVVDVPLALKIMGRPRDPAVRRAVGELRAWVRAGGLRKDADGDGAYEHADAIRILDAWWPRWVRAEFRPTLGRAAYDRITSLLAVDNPPNNGGEHLGSAYQGSFYGFVSKDLRMALHRRVRGRYARRYCGRGSLARCRRALERTLKAALAEPATAVYPADGVCKAGDQRCFDSIRQRPVGGETQPLIDWINRPTFQQANEIQHSVPR